MSEWFDVGHADDFADEEVEPIWHPAYERCLPRHAQQQRFGHIGANLQMPLQQRYRGGAKALDQIQRTGVFPVNQRCRCDIRRRHCFGSRLADGRWRPDRP